MIKRRFLKFHDFDEVPKEAEDLLARGYQQVGAWDLTQICDHLTGALTLSTTTGVRPMVPFYVRWYLKWRYLDLILKSGRLKSGVQKPGELESPPTGDPAEAIKRLREATDRLKAFKGEFKPHPYFGYMPLDKAKQFHLIHCAHHLGHLVPN
jgi:hypothetical protein